MDVYPPSLILKKMYINILGKKYSFYDLPEEDEDSTMNPEVWIWIWIYNSLHLQYFALIHYDILILKRTIQKYNTSNLYFKPVEVTFMTRSRVKGELVGRRKLGGKWKLEGGS